MLARNCTQLATCPRDVYVGYVYVLTAVSVAGIVLNATNIVVFTRTGQRGSPFAYLFGISVVDLVTCTLAMPVGMLRCVPAEDHGHVLAGDLYVSFIYLPVANSFATCSGWVTVAMSVDRFIYIKSPICARRYSTTKQAKRMMGVLFALSCCMNLPYAFAKTVRDGKVEVSTYGSSQAFVVYLWMRVILVKMLPIVITALFNGLLLRAVFKAAVRHKKMVSPNATFPRQRRQHSQRRLTVLLISVCVIFLACHVCEPFAHSIIYTTLFGPCSNHTYAYHMFRLIANILELISYTINFFAYCAFNGWFWNTFVGMIRCRRLQKWAKREHKQIRETDSSNRYWSILLLLSNVKFIVDLLMILV